MAWTLSGTWYEVCSCALYCPCNLGPAKPDQEWCSAGLAFDFKSGSSNGIDLGGTKAVFHGELPGDFMGGIDKAKLYLDESASQEQRDEIEAIFKGERGGLWEGVRGMIGEFLPSQTASIEITGGESPSYRIDGVGGFELERVKTEDGKQAITVNAPVAVGFGADTQELAYAKGGLSDPDLRAWETLGNGAAVPFAWSS